MALWFQRWSANLQVVRQICLIPVFVKYLFLAIRPSAIYPRYDQRRR